MSADIEILKKRFLDLSPPMAPEETGTEPLLKNLEGIRFVMFDFYGTLFISGVGDIGIDDGNRDSGLFLETLRACGYPADAGAAETGYLFFEETVHRHQEHLRSEGLDFPEPAIDRVWLEVLKKMYGEELIRGAPPGPGNARRFAVEFEARMNPVWPMPDLPGALKKIRECGATLGIISNSQFYTPVVFEALARCTLEELGFHDQLLHWSYAESLKKPSLEFYSRFLSKLKRSFPDAKPGEILYVGNDMLKDIYPASIIGMKTALFAGDSRSLKWRRDDDRCRSLRPDLVITNLTQIAGCLC